MTKPKKRKEKRLKPGFQALTTDWQATNSIKIINVDS